MTHSDSSLSASAVYDALANYQGPRFEDFPSVDLYMDQVVELLNRWLSPLFFNQKTPCITASMINNYVKTSIVHPPVKKKYTSYHLAYLYVVMILKQCFSLQEIAALITIYTEIGSSERISSDFNRFTSSFELLLHDVMQNGDTAVAIFQDPSWQQVLMVDVLVCRLYGTYQIFRYTLEKEKSERAKK